MVDKKQVQPLPEDAAQEGPFSPSQLRALKMLTAIMGILIIVCVILLGIGLARNADKLSEPSTPATITLNKGEVINQFTIDDDNSVWLYISGPQGEVIRQHKSDGGLGKRFTISR